MTEILAAGGVLWRSGQSPEDIEIAVIHRPRYDDWSLPKGKLDPGEELLEAAVREVWEETGHRVVVGPPLGSITYRKGNRDGGYQDKLVAYWAMREDGGTFVPGSEVDDLVWLPPARAEQRLSYAMDREVLGRCTWALGTGTDASARTVPSPE